MSLFDFFRNRKEKLIEELSFSKLDDWIGKSEEEIREIKKEKIIKIKRELKYFLNKLGERIEILERLDLGEKRVSARERLIVGENLIQFINYLKRLQTDLENLEGLNEESFENLNGSINLIFSSFEKRSFMAFQKATFLIGKELGEFKEALSEFFKNYNRIMDEGGGMIKDKVLKSISKKIEEIEEIGVIEKNNLRELRQIEENIKERENKIKGLEEMLEESKKSREYEEYLKKKKAIENLTKEFNQEILELKGLIDFRKLSSIYHSDKKQMKRINEYRERFVETLESEGKEKFIELLDIKDPNRAAIDNKLERIYGIKEHIGIDLNLEPGKELEEEIKRLGIKNQDLNTEKIKKQKIQQRGIDHKSEIKNEIILELNKINITLKD